MFNHTSAHQRLHNLHVDDVAAILYVENKDLFIYGQIITGFGLENETLISSQFISKYDFCEV